MEVLGKPDNKKLEHSPTPYAWKPFCPPAVISLALKIS
jgi:hypothetical protein